VANIKRANTSGITKTGVAISDVPDAPTIGAVADLGTGSTASVAYTAAATGGAATTFTATSSPGGLTGTGSSPITVSGLTDSVAYTFTVVASNSTGSSPASSASSSVTLAIPGKFESIATATGTGSSGVITFSSIPSTYKHLQIRGIAKDTYSAGAVELPTRVRFNSDTGNNYIMHNLNGNGTSAAAQYEATGTNAFFKFRGSNLSSDATYANMNAVSILDIIDYADTSKYKTARGFSGNDRNGAGSIFLISGLWLSTSAISTITLTADGTNWTTSTTFALYGIKGA